MISISRDYTPHYGDAAMTLIAILGAAIIIGLLAYVGIPRQEWAECEKLRYQAQEFSEAFYLTKWQDEMCRANGIIINAPVK